MRQSCGIKHQANYKVPFMSYSGDDVIGFEDTFVNPPCLPGYNCESEYWANRHYRAGRLGWQPPAWRWWPGGSIFAEDGRRPAQREPREQHVELSGGGAVHVRSGAGWKTLYLPEPRDRAGLFVHLEPWREWPSDLERVRLTSRVLLHLADLLLVDRWACCARRVRHQPCPPLSGRIGRRHVLERTKRRFRYQCLGFHASRVLLQQYDLADPLQH